MYTRHFTAANVKMAVEYLKSEGSTAAPIFMSFDSRGQWSRKGGKLFWTADDKSVGPLEVIPQEEVDTLVEKAWYTQDLPSGIQSLHKWLLTKYLGVSYIVVDRFVKKQKAWQMLKPLRHKTKARQSIVASKPFQLVEIDIADMISFGQTDQREDPRYILVLCDVFSGFCMAEIQTVKEAPPTLASFKKMIAAITSLGYGAPKILKSDQGPEFSGPTWTEFNKKMGWKRIFTKNYPAVHAERKIRTLKKYISLNSQMTRGDKTYWFNVVNSSVKATNRIHNSRGGSPEQILRMDLEKRREVLSKIKNLKKQRQSNISHKPRANEPSVGDSVRVRIPSEKVGMDYKSHLPYDKLGRAVKWSDKMHRVEKKRVSSSSGVVKVLAGGRWRFWPSEIMNVPADTQESKKMGQDGNIDYVSQKRGARRSTRSRGNKETKDFDTLWKDPPKLKRAR
jgi:hypothetical protein